MSSKTIGDVDREWASEVGPIPTTTGAAPFAGATGWQPTAAQLALELMQDPPIDRAAFLAWVERHAKRYLVVVREAERMRCAAIAARIGNAGDPRAMATASAILHEIEKGD